VVGARTTENSREGGAFGDKITKFAVTVLVLHTK
jgi:hypothetical protein